jgi:hypothetical protein
VWQVVTLALWLGACVFFAYLRAGMHDTGSRWLMTVVMLSPVIVFCFVGLVVLVSPGRRRDDDQS